MDGVSGSTSPQPAPPGVLYEATSKTALCNAATTTAPCVWRPGQPHEVVPAADQGALVTGLGHRLACAHVFEQQVRLRQPRRGVVVPVAARLGELVVSHACDADLARRQPPKGLITFRSLKARPQAERA
eukprot:scaffold23365_cov39-Phaeocystis_antarctica.AAC.2